MVERVSHFEAADPVDRFLGVMADGLAWAKADAERRRALVELRISPREDKRPVAAAVGVKRG